MFRKLSITFILFIASNIFTISYANDISSFEQLSPGNMKIADSIFNAQLDNPEKLSLNDIADMKLEDGKGWGEIFKGIQTDQKNLGQAIKQFKMDQNATHTLDTNTTQTRVKHFKKERSDVVITNGAGRQTKVGLKNKSLHSGKKTGSSNISGNSHKIHSVSRGKGHKVKSH